MSWSELSDSGICSVRSDCVGGSVGASSMTETMWVIPRLVSCASSRAVKRSVRNNRGSTSLAVCPRRKGGRRPLRCCAAAMRDVCQGWGLKESISRRGEVETVGGLRGKVTRPLRRDMWLVRVHYEGFQGVGLNCGNHVASRTSSATCLLLPLVGAHFYYCYINMSTPQSPPNSMQPYRDSSCHRTLVIRVIEPCIQALVIAVIGCVHP
jgi:hypothetical protein